MDERWQRCSIWQSVLPASRSDSQVSMMRAPKEQGDVTGEIALDSLHSGSKCLFRSEFDTFLWCLFTFQFGVVVVN